LFLPKDRRERKLGEPLGEIPETMYAQRKK